MILGRGLSAPIEMKNWGYDSRLSIFTRLSRKTLVKEQFSVPACFLTDSAKGLLFFYIFLNLK